MTGRYRPVDTGQNFPALEERTLGWWKERSIFEKSLELRAGNPEWVFYEGPPTANGKPGVHHVLARVFKDIYPRFKTMRGYHVGRKGGWDCHGLPVELEIEKRLGFDRKEQIETYGVAEFNRLCRESVTAYVDDWNRMTERIGMWLDLDDAYLTMTDGYIESVWWILAEFSKQGLLYEGYKVVPYCPRCGTALSSHEVASGYQMVTDPSVFVRFPLVAGPAPAGGRGRPAAPVAPAALEAAADGLPVSLLVWTTTPWTLISNVAAAVGADIQYANARLGDEYLILAADLVGAVLGPEATVVETFPGSALVGRHYRPPYEFVAPDKPAWRVIAADFVATDEGTGIVHIAPAFGADDMVVGQANDLPVIMPVDEEARFTAEVTPWAGVFVKDADDSIMDELESRGLLFGRQPYEHNYPHCWRCDTPLIYYAKTSWYVRTTARKEAVLAANEEVTWYPDHLKHGRFGKWLENNIDWSLSRDRYWGTPLPVWRCENGHDTVVGSRAQLGELAGRDLSELELHRPYVDEVTFACPECGAEARRVAAVIDAWFDSGSMPVAQWHYPFENQEMWEKRFPADFICEAIDQTRGWFYSLLAISALLTGHTSYRNVLCLGHILDNEGRKMSKRLGNVIDPWAILDKQGADALRWYLFTVSSPWFARRFGPENVDEVIRKFILTLWNTYSFYTLYANIDGFDPAEHDVPVAERSLMDRWILGDLHLLVRKVTAELDHYDAFAAGRAIADFVDELSNWYVRRSRRRFWKSEADADKIAAYLTLNECLVTLAELLAPFTPFLAEELYQNLVAERSPEVAGVGASVRLAGRRRSPHRRGPLLPHGRGPPGGEPGPRRPQRGADQDPPAHRGGGGCRRRPGAGRGREPGRRGGRGAERQSHRIRGFGRASWSPTSSSPTIARWAQVRQEHAGGGRRRGRPARRRDRRPGGRRPLGHGEGGRPRARVRPRGLRGGSPRTGRLPGGARRRPGGGHLDPPLARAGARRPGPRAGAPHPEHPQSRGFSDRRPHPPARLRPGRDRRDALCPRRLGEEGDPGGEPGGERPATGVPAPMRRGGAPKRPMARRRDPGASYREDLKVNGLPVTVEVARA